MIRNLKILIAAAMATAAFGALSASAHAAEEKFHCSVEPCTYTLQPDETAGTTTAHHVFVVKGKNSEGKEASVSFTCDRLNGHATTDTKTSTELTFTNPRYENAAGEAKCKVGASETVGINFTTCHYNFTSTGGSSDNAQVHVLCSTAGDSIDISLKGTLCLQITPLTATGIGYHTVGTTPNRTITATANVAVPAGALDLKNIGNANCAALGLSSITGATYTTGNAHITGQTDPGEVMADAWFE